MVERPDPAYVLETIHLLKTGLLFNIPFTGFDLIETDVDAEKASRLKAALRAFGGGCQILDDVRDLARDFVERRHNYVLSTLARDRPSVLAAWSQRPLKATDRLYGEARDESFAAARLGLNRLAEAAQPSRRKAYSTTGAPPAMARAMLRPIWRIRPMKTESDASALATRGRTLTMRRTVRLAFSCDDVLAEGVWDARRSARACAETSGPGCRLRHGMADPADRGALTAPTPAP